MAIQDNALIVVNRGGTTYKSTWGEVKPLIPQGLSGTMTYKVLIPYANFDFRLDALCDPNGGEWSVNFGDGSATIYRTVVTPGFYLVQQQHTYASAGEYLITIWIGPGLTYSPRLYATDSGKTITEVYIPDPISFGVGCSAAFGFNTQPGMIVNIGYNVTSTCETLNKAFLRNQFKYFPLIDTSGAINSGLGGTWNQCTELEQMPLIDTSNASDFTSTWSGCLSLKIFPPINTSSATQFQATWNACESLTTFPKLDVSKVFRFDYAWANCTNLADFPANFFDVTGDLESYTMQCKSAFDNCALTSQSVSDILVSWDVNGANNIEAGISGGTNAGLSSLSAAGTTAYNNLIAKGWTITINA